MKYTYFTGFLIGVALQVNSQSFSNFAASPLTKLLLTDIKSGKKESELSKEYMFRPMADGELHLGFLIGTSNKAQTLHRLKELDAIVGTVTNSVISAKIPISSIADLNTIPFCTYLQVDEPMQPHLNMARRTTRVDSVHRGINLPLRYSGKEVVMGVIDFGFDYNHPSFFDTLGQQYRVSKAWDVNVNLNPPQGFGYGNELIGELEIRNEGTDNPQQTHGTAVAGISAGSGFGGPSNKYRGMAYESELVFVSVRRDSIENQWMQGGFSDFADAINYCFQYADEVQKPAVVNISWGSQSGPHDGTTLFNQVCNNLTGAGKLLAMSAGNDGEDSIHIKKTFQPTDTLLQTFLKFSSPNYMQTWVDIWGDTGMSYTASVALFSNGQIVSETPFHFSLDSIFSYTLTGNEPGDSVQVRFISEINPYNSKVRLTIPVFNFGNDTVLVSIKSNSGSIHAWNEYYYYGYKHGFQSNFSSFDKVGFTAGNTQSTVSDNGSAESVLMVGAYASKTGFTDINNNNWSYSGYVNSNKLVPFSSRGPLTNGTIKPDLCAPGLTLATAISSYDTDYTPTGLNSDLTVYSTTHGINNETFYYAEFTGTSASSPAAAGILALLLQVNPTLTPEEAKQILFSTILKDVHTGSLPSVGNNNWGKGKINAYRAILSMLPAGERELESDNLAITLYPNPAKDMVTIEAFDPNESIVELQIFDMNGSRKVLNSFEGNSTQQVSIKSLAAAVYFVKVTTNNKSYVKKLFVGNSE